MTMSRYAGLVSPQHRKKKIEVASPVPAVGDTKDFGYISNIQKRNKKEKKKGVDGGRIRTCALKEQWIVASVGTCRTHLAIHRLTA